MQGTVETEGSMASDSTKLDSSGERGAIELTSMPCSEEESKTESSASDAPADDNEQDDDDDDDGDDD